MDTERRGEIKAGKKQAPPYVIAPVTTERLGAHTITEAYNVYFPPQTWNRLCKLYPSESETSSVSERMITSAVLDANKDMPDCEQPTVVVLFYPNVQTKTKHRGISLGFQTDPGRDFTDNLVKSLLKLEE